MSDDTEAVVGMDRARGILWPLRIESRDTT
jgi:hypothetical protein